MPADQHLGRQFSAAEVSLMSDDEAADVRSAGASYQRGRPESAMNAAVNQMGGGVYPYLLEHVGDLTHRMNEMAGKLGTEYVTPKIRKAAAVLNHPYGFEKEMGENIRSNAPYGKLDSAGVKRAGQAYADEHRKVPVYNYPSEIARNAAVALGEHRFDDARSHIGELRAMDEGGQGPSKMKWAEGDLAGLLDRGLPKQATVDYLRDKESRTPAITDAATVMLGGRLKR